MIPSVLARQVRQGVEDFLRATFPTSTPYFHGMLDRFLEREKELFQGPYLSVRLPFRQGSGRRDRFPGIPLPYAPYLHQERSFERLSGELPHSTLVATGTGSGKTECFLLPVLDYCLRHAGDKGIKAIFIYPMNALATDQARRIAQLIYDTPALRGRVTAGLFVGQSEADPAMTMTRDRVITHKNTMRQNPPDILLTNYKMLDYLLLRPGDRDIWQHNRPETLKYLVVDELHTFDGAQGTDLACLIRRLKGRLAVPDRYLCCVGTSATMGSEAAAKDLVEYASLLFGEQFSPDAVVTEARLGPGEFLGNSLVERLQPPPVSEVDKLDPEHYHGERQYIEAQLKLWFDWELADGDYERPDWRVELGERLKGHLLFQNLIKQLDNKTSSYRNARTSLDRFLPREGNEHYRELIFVSLLALVAAARVWREETPEDAARREAEGLLRKTRPFVQLHVQIWLREMRRMVATVASPEDTRPELHFSDDLKPEALASALPVIHCRECGAMGWVSKRRSLDGQETAAMEDLRAFYNRYFAKDPDICHLFPGVADERIHGKRRQLCVRCLAMYAPHDNNETCSVCGGRKFLDVFVPDMARAVEPGRVEMTEDCPFCSGKKSLSILGYSSAGFSSVMISQIFASPFNDDKKLLTFSDSVQDAAHRAGFFAARTYRFNLRTAIQQYLREVGSAQSLPMFIAGLNNYWRERMSAEEYVTTFLPAKRAWLREYQEMLRTEALAVDSTLPDDVAKCMTWEVYSEYGLNCRIGRTLEKSGCSTLTPELDRFAQTVAIIHQRITNELGELGHIGRRSVELLAIGFWMQMKHRGGIFHDILLPYVDSLGNTWQLGNRFFWLPDSGEHTRAPMFFAQPGRRACRFDMLSRSHGSTWYEQWYDKCLGGEYALSGELIEPVYRILLDELTAAGILMRRDVQGRAVWGLAPERLMVKQGVAQMRCDCCDHILPVAADLRDIWEDAPCTRTSCRGRYRYDTVLSERVNYYGHLYNSGQVSRVFASEHTGLLTREEREKVEKRFKAAPANRRPWYPNLLSCTPTLEMGIDIGDLSSLLLCSVPPGQAQYTQRAGRAGRRDGNAFHATVANAKRHDLHFFADPMGMIQGEVPTPGVFLNASAVLERQLTAYCFDHWVNTDIPANALPVELGRVLSAWRSNNGGQFPRNFLAYVKKNQEELFQGFVSLFGDEIEPAAIARLREFLMGSGAGGEDLEYRVTERLDEVVREVDALSRKVRQLAERIKVNKAKPRDTATDNELRELQGERAAVQELLKQIKQRDTLNFFTDEGLLPNYAFPEAGVTLRSIIWRRRQVVGEGEDQYETTVYDYERSATSALRELAPTSEFYAGGRKVVVDRVDLSVSEPELWRFCPNCNHAAREGVEPSGGACPRCGDPQWADQGQQRQLLRLRQVYANTEDKASYITDDSDNRKTVFFNQTLLVDFAPEQVVDSYALHGSDLPFGYEYISKAQFRDINLGLSDDNAGGFRVAGRMYRSRGFEVCRSCGKVKTGKDFRHQPSCTARDQESDASFMELLCLYREMSSEAVRVLLPVVPWTDAETSLHSLVAALHLGLKQVFRGSIDHLRTTLYEEPVPNANYRKQYLMIYDTVPGGTGYLKQLMQEETSLLNVLTEALKILQACRCQHDTEKDGCYSCLYAYNTSSQMQYISRKTAIRMLSAILAEAGKLRRVENLGTVKMNPLFDSELERRFIAALQRYHWNGANAEVRKGIVNNKPGYILNIEGRIWYIEPQVSLGHADGVAIPSKVDFMFIPARSQDGHKPIAVFTDGYAFHHNRVGQDMAQRMAIAASGRFLVWSLSFKDVENVYGTGQGDYYINPLAPAHLPSGNLFDTVWNRFFTTPFALPHRQDSFTWLARLLQDPREDDWQKAALAYSLSVLTVGDSKANQEAWQREVRELLPACWDDIPVSDVSLLGRTEFPQENGEGGITLYAAAAQEAITMVDPHKLFILLQLDDLPENQDTGFERIWNGFIRMYNLLQFLPHALAVTVDGLAKHQYDDLVFDTRRAVDQARIPEAGWGEVRDLVDETLYPLLTALEAYGMEAPGAGIEIEIGGRIAAQAELAWEEHRLAVVSDEYFDAISELEAAGWRVFSLAGLLAGDTVTDDLRVAYESSGTMSRG